MNEIELRFPIGKFEKPAVITNEIIQGWIKEIQVFPAKLKAAVANLNDEQLNTTYRPNGWTIRQVVHHCADSHMNAFIRIKLALTEEAPTIKPYHEDRWALLPDGEQLSIKSSLQIIEALHERWTYLLFSLKDEQLNKSFIHPEHGKTFTIAEVLGMYAWHSNHHLAHITNLIKKQNWL